MEVVDKATVRIIFDENTVKGQVGTRLVQGATCTSFFTRV